MSLSCDSPGHTDTDFFDRADISRDSKFYAQKTSVLPRSVAQDPIQKMFSGKLSSIHGVKNNVLAFLSKTSPSRKITARVSKKLVAR
jgi:short-subunit dehydrogenase